MNILITVYVTVKVGVLLSSGNNSVIRLKAIELSTCHTYKPMMEEELWTQEDWEKTLTCPYDVSHEVLPHKIGNHLAKCKKRAAKENPAGQEQTSCPNNPCPTEIAKAELIFHLKYNCKYGR